MSEETPTTGTAEEEPGLYPVDSKWFEIGFYGFWLLWIGYILAETATFEASQDWLFPLVLGVPITGMLLLKLFVILKPDYVRRVLPESEKTDGDDGDLQRRIEEASSPTDAGRSKRERHEIELVMIGWVLALPILMFVFGIGFAFTVYVFAFTWYFVRSVRTAALVTVVVLGFIYVLFIEILGMVLWKGILGLPDPLAFVDGLLAVLPPLA